MKLHPVALGALLYLLAAATFGPRPWDGFAPEPYRWVQPPPGVTSAAPAPATGTIAFSGGVSSQVQVYTADLQAQLLIPAGALPPDAGGRPVTLSITPQAPPPLGTLVAAGNAYLVRATYADGSPVPEPWKKPAQVYLRFPEGTVPDALYRLDNGQPVRLTGTVDTPTMTTQAESDRGGTFVNAHPPSAQGAPRRIPPWASFGASGLLLALGVGLVILGRRLVARDPGS